MWLHLSLVLSLVQVDLHFTLLTTREDPFLSIKEWVNFLMYILLKSRWPYSGRTQKSDRFELTTPCRYYLFWKKRFKCPENEHSLFHYFVVWACALNRFGTTQRDSSITTGGRTFKLLSFWKMAVDGWLHCILENKDCAPYFSMDLTMPKKIQIFDTERYVYFDGDAWIQWCFAITWKSIWQDGSKLLSKGSDYLAYYKVVVS